MSSSEELTNPGRRGRDHLPVIRLLADATVSTLSTAELDAQLVLGVLGLDLLNEELLYGLVAFSNQVDRVGLLVLPRVLREAAVLAVANHLASLKLGHASTSLTSLAMEMANLRAASRSRGMVAVWLMVEDTIERALETPAISAMTSGPESG